jgi:hypothetical protein
MESANCRLSTLLRGRSRRIGGADRLLIVAISIEMARNLARILSIAQLPGRAGAAKRNPAVAHVRALSGILRAFQRKV